MNEIVNLWKSFSCYIRISRFQNSDCFIFDSECMFFMTKKILLVIILTTSKIKANQIFNQQFAWLLVLISSPEYRINFRRHLTLRMLSQKLYIRFFSRCSFANRFCTCYFVVLLTPRNRVGVTLFHLNKNALFIIIKS